MENPQYNTIVGLLLVTYFLVQVPLLVVFSLNNKNLGSTYRDEISDVKNIL